MSSGVMIAVGIAFVVLLLIIQARGHANKQLVRANSELAAALREEKSQAAESKLVLARKIEELEHRIASLLEVPSQDALRGVGEKVRLLIPPDGSEVFLPLLDPHCVYQISVHGTFKFSESTGWFSSRDAYADALYRTNEVGNFSLGHECLKLAGVPVRRTLRSIQPEVMREEDRAAHRYSFRIDGTQKKISASFLLRFEKQKDNPTGTLTLTLEVLPEGTPSPNAARRKEEAALEQTNEGERVRRAAAARAQDEQKRSAALHMKLESFRLRVQCQSHFLDPILQREFAARDSKEILQCWQPLWVKEYCEFMKDVEFKKFAEEQAPEVQKWLEARVKIVQLAERMRIASLPSCEVKEPPKPLTVEETRAAKLQKHADEHDDRIALAKLKGEKAVEADAVLESLSLDGDLKERLKTELTDSILDNENGNRTGGNNVTV